MLAALIALGRLAHDLGDRLESIDINPFVALPGGQGALALDALVVLRECKGSVAPAMRNPSYGRESMRVQSAAVRALASHRTR